MDIDWQMARGTKRPWNARSGKWSSPKRRAVSGISPRASAIVKKYRRHLSKKVNANFAKRSIMSMRDGRGIPRGYRKQRIPGKDSSRLFKLPWSNSSQPETGVDSVAYMPNGLIQSDAGTTATGRPANFTTGYFGGHNIQGASTPYGGMNQEHYNFICSPNVALGFDQKVKYDYQYYRLISATLKFHPAWSRSMPSNLNPSVKNLGNPRIYIFKQQNILDGDTTPNTEVAMQALGVKPIFLKGGKTVTCTFKPIVMQKFYSMALENPTPEQKPKEMYLPVPMPLIRTSVEDFTRARFGRISVVVCGLPIPMTPNSVNNDSASLFVKGSLTFQVKQNANLNRTKY